MPRSRTPSSSASPPRYAISSRRRRPGGTRRSCSRPAPLPVPPRDVVPKRRVPWKRLAVVLAAMLGLIFLVLGPGGAPGGKPEGDASAVVPDITRPQPLVHVSRGRSAATIAPEAVAVAQPSAAPTAEPTVVPSAAPRAGAGGTGGAGGSARRSRGGGGGLRHRD